MPKATLARRFKFVALIIFAMSFAPLLYGALTSLFWVDNSEQSESHIIVSRLTQSVDGPPSFFSRHKSMQFGSRCRVIAFHQHAKRPQPAMIEQNVDLAVDTQVRLEIKENIHSIRTQQLRRLPSVVLGVLDACDRSTILSPLCRAYTSSKLQEIEPAEIQKIRQKAYQAADPRWCAILDAIDPKLKNAKVLEASL